MSRTRGPQDRPTSGKKMTFSERAAARRAQNKIDAARRGKKFKEFFFKENPNSPKAKLRERKALAEANRRTTKIGKESKTPKKLARVRGSGDRAAKPKTTVVAPRAKVAPTSAGKAAAKPSTAKRAMAGLSEFGKAFAAARKAGKKDFTFRDKQYAAITKQEVQKSGASSLGDYLNKLKRKPTKVVKAKLKVGGSVDEEKLQKAADRGAMIEKTKKALDMDTAFKKRNRKMAAEAERMIKETERYKRMADRQGIDAPEGTVVRRTGRGMRRMGGPMGSAEVSRLEQMMPREMERDFDTRRYKSGGSVMARGCKMGKKKPTKLY